MSKDMFIEAHEELIAEYLDAHPTATWELAYDRTADAANDRMADKYAAMIDWARMQQKENFADE